MGNSAALNSRTMRLMTRSGRVNALGGTSGARATRFSTTGNRHRSTEPTAMGTSADAEPHPSLPAVTPP